MNKRRFKVMNKSKKKLLVFAYLISLIVAGIVFGTDDFYKKEQVEAHPTNTIKLDEGGGNEFTLPFDASKLEEQALKDLAPQYNNYVQGEDIVPVMEKDNVTAYGSNNVNNSSISWYINDIKKTDGGNYLVLFGAEAPDKGGIIKVSVFNKAGDELATKVMGTLENATLRVQTSFFEAANNNFLLKTSGDQYFKCLVSSETNSSANITLNKLNTTGNRKQLKIHELKKMYTDKRINNLPIGFGSIYPNYPDREGFIRKRIPVGTMNSQGWQTGNMTAELKHAYSLENLLFSDIGYTEGGYESIHPNLCMNDNQIIYGDITYYNGIDSRNYKTIEIFSQENVNISGVTLKKRKYIFHDEDESRSNNLKVQVLKEISDTKFVYFLNYAAGETQLYQVDLSTYTDKIVQRFPPETRLLISDNGDGTLSYYGSTKSLTGEFNSPYYSSILNSPYYYVQGIMDNFESATPAKVRSIRAMELSDWLLPSNILSIETNKLFIAGKLLDYQTFADQSHIVAADGSVTAGIPKNTGAFVGIIKIMDDYSPIIQKAPDITVDLDNPAICTPTGTTYRNWTTLDRWLITGTMSGTVTGAAAIKVYDHFDSNDSLIAATTAGRAEWLQKRINRNPNDIKAAIEWEKLGFDKTTPGAQLVTYFVTDSQNQPGVTSRWVNKKTDETIISGNYALDAHNFHVPLTGIDAAIPDANKFKELAKTMAWSLTNHESSAGDHGNGLDEDGTDPSKLSAKVTVDANQLKALREATVAKPYPVDVTYRPESGKVIRNRVWVFVTTKNTVPNSETNPKVTPEDTNGVVYYADDYSMPFRLRSGHTAADVLNRGNVRVYNYYDATHESHTELPVLADKTTNASKLQVINLNAIQSAAQPGLIDSSPPDGAAMIRYRWSGAVNGNHQSGNIKPTLGGLDVTLTGDILLHVRQVIVGDSDQLVVPEEGYLRIASNDYVGMSGTAENADQLRQVRILSGKNADNPGFETIAVNTDHMDHALDELELKLIIPEYYEAVGNYLTLGAADKNGASHAGKTEANSNMASLIFQRDKLYNDGEYFITIYLKPKMNQEGPQPYSWDYKKNDLGKIKTK